MLEAQRKYEFGLASTAEFIEENLDAVHLGSCKARRDRQLIFYTTASINLRIFAEVASHVAGSSKHRTSHARTTTYRRSLAPSAGCVGLTRFDR